MKLNKQNKIGVGGKKKTKHEQKHNLYAGLFLCSEACSNLASNNFIHAYLFKELSSVSTSCKRLVSVFPYRADYYFYFFDRATCVNKEI